MRKVLPRTAALLPPGTQPARADFLLASLRASDRPARDVVPSGNRSGQRKVGQCSRETAPLQSGRSYFFFAFLAFLAAFFAFLAIVPPEGVQLCLMATQARGH